MIRRLFWLLTGALLGVAVYRRATALARSLSPPRRAESLACFVSDVRAGMDDYMARRPGVAPHTLDNQQTRSALRHDRVRAVRPGAGSTKDGR